MLKMNGDNVDGGHRDNEGYVNGSVEMTMSSSTTSTPEMITASDDRSVIQLSRWRFVVLALFVVQSMSNAFQWIEYSIIANVICSYYGVASIAVDWTSIIFMVLYVPLVFPASWLLNRRGLRFCVLLGSAGTALGAIIKCASVATDRFLVTFIGQTIVAASQVFILGIPPHLAAVWFGANEVSTACSVGVFGNQLGIALGFLLPPEIVRNSVNLDEIGRGLTILFYSMAAITSLIFILIVIFFRAKPERPPSQAAAASEINKSLDDDYIQSILRLVRNRNYIMLLISYGINVGVFYAISTLLNQVVLAYFPGEERNAGRIGLSIVISGMIGSLLCGLWLDKTHKFKETTLAVYVLSLIGMMTFTFQFKLHAIVAVFIAAASLGFFMTGYLPLGFEFAAEITYPESEGTSSGLLNASAQVFGISFTLLTGWMLSTYGDIPANIMLCGTLIVGVIITLFVKSELKRQAAQTTLTSINVNSKDQIAKM